MPRILLVDDDPDIRVVAEVALASVGGWDVVTVDSGPAAIEAVRQQLPDLIILDVMMPGMDGLTTLARLQELGGVRAIPVVFLTARVQQSDVEIYRAAGAHGALAKPFDPMTLAAEVAHLVGWAV